MHNVSKNRPSVARLFDVVDGWGLSPVPFLISIFQFLAGGRTLIPKNAFGWPSFDAMRILRGFVPESFLPGRPG
jgi:hypothetical protein